MERGVPTAFLKWCRCNGLDNPKKCREKKVKGGEGNIVAEKEFPAEKTRSSFDVFISFRLYTTSRASFFSYLVLSLLALLIMVSTKLIKPDYLLQSHWIQANICFVPFLVGFDSGLAETGFNKSYNFSSFLFSVWKIASAKDISVKLHFFINHFRVRSTKRMAVFHDDNCWLDSKVMFSSLSEYVWESVPQMVVELSNIPNSSKQVKASEKYAPVYFFSSFRNLTW